MLLRETIFLSLALFQPRKTGNRSDMTKMLPGKSINDSTTEIVAF